MLRFFKSFLLRVLLLSVAVGVAYLFTDGFGLRWRAFVMGKMEERGVHIEFSRFGLHPIDGLVARDVRVFSDEQRQHVLLTIDRVNMDLDYSKLIKKQFFIEGLELSAANVALPLDPDKPDAGQVDLHNLNARVFIIDDRLEIRRAEGEVAGVQLSVTGSIQLTPRKDRTPEEIKLDEQNSAKRMAFLREKRGQIQEGLRWLKRFTFTRRPQIALKVNGSADKLENLKASLHFKAEGLGYESYTCKELAAWADYHEGVIEVRQFRLQDKMGTLESTATWDMAGDDVRFRLHTTADLPQLAKCFLLSDALREIVFYESAPPSLTLEGTWYVKGPKAMQKRPIEAIGQVQAGRFNTRGEVFEGLSASFGVAPEGYYIRDGLLRHKSGSVTLQAMFQEIEGFKYRAVLRMDPHAFLPFAGEEAARELIRRFEFSENSTIFVGLEGQGPDTSLATCRNMGRAEFRDLKYRGVEFNSAEGEMEFFNQKLIFRNASAVVRTGTAEAREVVVETGEKWVKLTGVKGKLDPVPVTSVFARQTAEVIARYHLTPNTEVSVDGMIGMNSADVTNLSVKFKSPDGSGTYPIWGRDYLIHSPNGTLDFKGMKMAYKIKGRVFGGPMSAQGHVDLNHDSNAFDVDVTAEHFPFNILGKEVQFEKVKAEVKSGHSVSPFEISAQVLGGTFGLNGTLDTSRQPAAYKGTLRLDAISFQRFARVYAPGQESEGDVTGHMEFTGRMNDWKALRGTGAMVLLNGNLYAVPVLGPLTPLLGALLPTPIKGYNVAREANCTFQVGDGFVATDDFEALTSSFKLLARGAVDFIKDDINFTAKARARGLPGLVLLPVSELLEYKGEGTVKVPNWRPHYFSVGEGRRPDERIAPSAAELGAANKAIQRQGAQSEPVREKRRVMPTLRK
ncbi:MAG: AsmA-like C-terminal region [Verrucomicrobiaceae bacterium]|nr:AsmA-like C-terminal region [Verrucomicrobiaceae bacterium]